jgi:membrane-bound serine protease (ClpP class)
MAPGSVIGAATPVMLVPGAGVADLPKSYQEKINSAMRALIRATAQQKGHNPDVFEAMVDSDKEVVIEGQTINPKGKLLTLTSGEAARAYGKPPRSLLSAGTAKSLDELFEKAGLPNATVLRVSPFGFELLARWITMISPLLILVGFLALYVELSHPGVALPALAAIVCFGIYFFGYLAAGLAGWEAVALFVVGVALLALEIFVIPGFGITGVLGIGAILVALVMAMVETAPGGPRIPTWSQLQVPVVKLAIGVGGATVAAMVLGRYLPKSTLFKKMELSAATSAAEGYTTASGSAKTLLGTSGVAETMLRPSGKGRFGEQLVDVVTEGDLIERGTPITIVKVEGSRVVVTRASA